MYPAVFHVVKQHSRSRLLILIRLPMILPILVWAGIYGIAAGFAQIVAFWAILFTGRHPQVLWDLLEGYFRFAAKFNAYMMYLTDKYPPFTVAGEHPYPVKIAVRYTERFSRATTLFRSLLLIPHFFYAVGYVFLFAFVHFASFWTILVLGRQAEWQFRFTERFFIYVMRINAYALLLVDEYPPFNGLQPLAVEETFH